MKLHRRTAMLLGIIIFLSSNVLGKRDCSSNRFGAVAVAGAALALPDLGAAVKRVVRLLLEHSGDGLTDDVALVLASSRDNVT